MNEKKAKTLHNLRRKLRIRSTIKGTAIRPRLTVFISNNNVSAQIIDDDLNKTLVYVSTVAKKNPAQTMTEKATWVGQEIAKQALTKKIKSVVFDRNGKIYHGRIAALANAARESGLEI